MTLPLGLTGGAQYVSSNFWKEKNVLNLRGKHQNLNSYPSKCYILNLLNRNNAVSIQISEKSLHLP